MDSNTLANIETSALIRKQRLLKKLPEAKAVLKACGMDVDAMIEALRDDKEVMERMIAIIEDLRSQIATLQGQDANGQEE